MRRLLYEHRDDSIWIHIEIYYDDKGQLVVHGNDSGEKVIQLRGKSDYECYILIKETDIPKLSDSLKNELSGPSKSDILDWFQQHFSSNKAVSEIMKKMEQFEVPFEFTTW